MPSARIIAMLIAYAAAMVTAAATLSLLFIIGFPFTQDMGPPDANLDGFLLNFRFFLFFNGFLSLFPGTVAIVAAEVSSCRAWPFHALGGALVVTCPQLLLFRGSEMVNTGFLLELLGSGAMGGLVYWSLIGRTAGSAYDARQRTQ